MTKYPCKHKITLKCLSFVLSLMQCVVMNSKFSLMKLQILFSLLIRVQTRAVRENGNLYVFQLLTCHLVIGKAIAIRECPSLAWGIHNTFRWLLLKPLKFGMIAQATSLVFNRFKQKTNLHSSCVKSPVLEFFEYHPLVDAFDILLHFYSIFALLLDITCM